jgi:hypothetical protein
MKKTILVFIITICLIFKLSALPVEAKIKSCPLNPSKIDLEEICKIEIGKLHPTQAKVGMYQVKYNQALLEVISQQESDKFDSIENYLQKKQVPVVIGPGNIYYMVDRHHTMRSIWDYYQGNPQIKVYIKVIKNWSKKKNFWQEMKENNYTYLGASGTEINPNQLPTNIGDLTNDNYRAAVGLAVKWAFFDSPKGEAKYFYQFKWGNCLKDLGFKLPEKLDRDKIYATAAFLYNNDNQAKMAKICNLQITKGREFKDIVRTLENN